MQSRKRNINAGKVGKKDGKAEARAFFNSQEHKDLKRNAEDRTPFYMAVVVFLWCCLGYYLGAFTDRPSPSPPVVPSLLKEENQNEKEGVKAKASKTFPEDTIDHTWHNKGVWETPCIEKKTDTSVSIVYASLLASHTPNSSSLPLRHSFSFFLFVFLSPPPPFSASNAIVYI